MALPPSTFWGEHPELVEQLRTLWGNLEVSAADIGRRFGCSKNAVISKARRMGLEPRTEPKVKHPPNIALDALEANSCRFPIGHPGDPDFHFCGEDVQAPGRPYCAPHYARSVIKARPKQEAAE